ALPQRWVVRLRGDRGPDDPLVLSLTIELAEVHLDAGRPREAVPILEEALPKLAAKLGPNHTAVLHDTSILGAAYAQTGRPAEAVALLERALAGLKGELPPDHPPGLGVSGRPAPPQVAARQP